MGTVTWFLEDEQLTINQEFFCWRFALHGVGMKAWREAYWNEGRNKKPPTSGYANKRSWELRSSAKIVRRIRVLRKMHDAGDIDLRQGPWDYYDRHDIGAEVDPGMGHIRRIRQEQRDQLRMEALEAE